MDADRDDQVLVIGYLSAVAAALDEHAIAVRVLRLGPLPETLSGQLVLHPGLTEVTWSAQSGWFADLRCGINGHRITRRYLNREPVPAPVVAAGFIAALVAGQAAGDLAPELSPDHRRDGHQQLINQLGRFVVPDPTGFTDAYLYAITDLIERKRLTGDTIAAPTAPGGEESMTDLFTALKRGVEAARAGISGSGSASGFPAAAPSVPTQRATPQRRANRNHQTNPPSPGQTRPGQSTRAGPAAG
jgi:hypothetical protein